MVLRLCSGPAIFPSPEKLRFLGDPHRHENGGGAPTRDFGPILPSDEADMPFSGTKKITGSGLPEPSLLIIQVPFRDQIGGPSSRSGFPSHVPCPVRACLNQAAFICHLLLCVCVLCRILVVSSSSIRTWHHRSDLPRQVNDPHYTHTLPRPFRNV